MTLRLTNLAIAAAIVVIGSSPASAVCFARDVTKPGGWDWDHSVGVRTFPVADEFRRAFIVGTVKVISVRELHEDRDDPEGVSAHSYRVLLVRSFKGPAPAEFTLYNQNSTARFDMDIGGEYLVLVQNAGTRSVVDNCGWSDDLERATDTLLQVERLAEVNAR